MSEDNTTIILSIKGQVPIVINGEPYWTIKQFTEITGYSEASIRRLLIYGNSIRKLKSVKFEIKPYIPYQELFDYRFVKNGRPDSLGMYSSIQFLINKEGELIKEENREYPKSEEEDDEEEFEDKDDFVSNDIIDDKGNRENDIFEDDDEFSIEEEGGALLGIDDEEEASLDIDEEEASLDIEEED